jgi:hypothetical protein
MAQQPERLSTLLRSVSRAIAASEDARLRNGHAVIRSHSGIKVWSASEVEQQQRKDEQDDARDEREETPAAVSPRHVDAPAGCEPPGLPGFEARLPERGSGGEAFESIPFPAEPVAPIDEGSRLLAEAVPATSEERAAPVPWLSLAVDACAESIRSALVAEPSTALARARPASELTHKMLAAVEAQLAKEIGPVARVLVAKYAKQSEDLASLGVHLGGHIPSETGRIRFEKALLALSEEMHHGSGVDATQAGLRTLQQRQDVAPCISDQRGAPTAQQIQAAGAKLAAYLGPIAHVIAKREAQSAVDLDTLLQRLTEAIRNDADRDGFRAACRDLRRM